VSAVTKDLYVGWSHSLVKKTWCLMSDAELVFLRWTYKLEEKGDDEGVKRLDVRQHGEHGVAHEASGGRHDAGRVGRQAYAQPGSDWTTA
jgi:hypothetical protein